MKKRLLLGTLCALALMNIVSCKTAQKATNTTQSTETQQVENWQPRNLTAIEKEILDGSWTFIDAQGKPAVGDQKPHIIFDTTTRRIMGHNGCNNFNGTLYFDENCGMHFTDCISTLQACRPAVTDDNVMQALATTQYYNITLRTNQSITMTLIDKDGNIVATLSREVKEMLSGMWQIIEVDGTAVKLDEMPSMVLDIESKRLTGNSGCNIMNGDITFDPQKPDYIAFTNVISTRRMCAPNAMDVEDKVLNAINKVSMFRFIDENKVALLSATSTQALLIISRK